MTKVLSWIRMTSIWKCIYSSYTGIYLHPFPMSSGDVWAVSSVCMSLKRVCGQGSSGAGGRRGLIHWELKTLYSSSLRPHTLEQAAGEAAPWVQQQCILQSFTLAAPAAAAASLVVALTLVPPFRALCSLSHSFLLSPLTPLRISLVIRVPP
jgi:hypothetical protein